MDQRIDELLSQEGMRSVVAAVVAKRLSEHLRLPPFRQLVGFALGELSGESRVVFFDLIGGASNDCASSVGVRIEETQLIAVPLPPFRPPDRRVPVDADPE